MHCPLDKDVDCMNPINLAKVFESDFSRLVPATPMAAMKVMEYYGIELEGKTVAVDQSFAGFR